MKGKETWSGKEAEGLKEEQCRERRQRWKTRKDLFFFFKETGCLILNCFLCSLNLLTVITSEKQDKINL